MDFKKKKKKKLYHNVLHDLRTDANGLVDNVGGEKLDVVVKVGKRIAE